MVAVTPIEINKSSTVRDKTATRSLLQMIATYCMHHIIQFNAIQCMAKIDVDKIYTSSVAGAIIVMTVSII